MEVLAMNLPGISQIIHQGSKLFSCPGKNKGGPWPRNIIHGGAMIYTWGSIFVEFSSSL